MPNGAPPSPLIYSPFYETSERVTPEVSIFGETIMKSTTLVINCTYFQSVEYYEANTSSPEFLRNKFELTRRNVFCGALAEKNEKPPKKSKNQRRKTANTIATIMFITTITK